VNELNAVISKKPYYFYILVFLVLFGFSLYFYYPKISEIIFNSYFILNIFWKSIYINSSFAILLILIIKYKNLTFPAEELSNLKDKSENKSLYSIENLSFILNYVGIVLGLIFHLFIMFITGVISIVFSLIMVKKQIEKNKIHGLMLIGLIETLIFITYSIFL